MHAVASGDVHTVSVVCGSACPLDAQQQVRAMCCPLPPHLPAGLSLLLPACVRVTCNQDGGTALMLATLLGNVEVVKVLLDRGCLTDVKNIVSGRLPRAPLPHVTRP